ncbi:MAG: hypothetical protein EOO16_03130 [Chitinophagaceae bacterium]|nr:MAG: hypothetical protein EOO16_03130 [Chitinophagaceae bacterium]
MEEKTPTIWKSYNGNQHSLRSPSQITRAIVAGADPDASRGVALSFAIDKGSAAQVKALLDGGATVEWDDGPNPTARTLPYNRKMAHVEGAIMSRDSTDKLKYLAAAGVDITDLFKGNSPFNLLPLKDTRSPEESTATAHLLMDAGAPVNIKSSSGDTPLHAMVAAGVDESVLARAVLLGANLNARNDAGRTPLFNISTPEQAMALLNLGADPIITDNQGRTADQAQWERETIEVIETAIARRKLEVVATQSRPQSDLASPDECKARRSRGRAM